MNRNALPALKAPLVTLIAVIVIGAMLLYYVNFALRKAKGELARQLRGFETTELARGNSGGYSASKFALCGWNDALHLEEAPDGFAKMAEFYATRARGCRNPGTITQSSRDI